MKSQSNLKAWMGAALIAALMCMSTAQSQARSVDLSGCTAQTAYSPNGEGAELIISTIKRAQQSIRMATYSFTEPAIGKALLDAKKRGVDVAVVVDKEHNGRRPPGSPSVASFLAQNGVSVMVSTAYRIQHNKVLIIDGETVQTGSFNYSRAAQKDNAENVLVISRCPRLADDYLRDWSKLRSSATAGVL
jgi:phosphatidylserine/phosphatidylglycerophosphate/cardiolipin synthase-like enzyme